MEVAPGPHAAAHGVDEYTLIVEQVCLRRQCIVRGDERLGNRRRIGPGQAVGNPRHRRRVGHEKLGVPAPWNDAEDAVANAPLGHRGSERSDFARELESRNVLRRTGWSRIVPFSLVQIRTIERRPVNADQDLVRGRRGRGTLPVLRAPLVPRRA